MSASTIFVSVDFDGIVEVVRYDEFVRRLLKNDSYAQKKFHVALGICSEAGELADVIKRELIYNKTTDSEGKSTKEGILEELGDLRFYMQAVQMLYGMSDQEVLQYNANKLGKRYVGLAYSDAAALGRADKSS